MINNYKREVITLILLHLKDCMMEASCFLKNVSIAATFSFIFSLFKQTIQFIKQINVKKCQIHPVYGAGIQTHDLQNMSLLP